MRTHTPYQRTQVVYIPTLGMHGTIHAVGAHKCTVRGLRGNLVTLRYALVVAL